MDELPQFLSPRDLAELCQVSLNTVYRWNNARIGPPIYKIGRHVRYRLVDVHEWINSRRTDPEETH